MKSVATQNIYIDNSATNENEVKDSKVSFIFFNSLICTYAFLIFLVYENNRNRKKAKKILKKYHFAIWTEIFLSNIVVSMLVNSMKKKKPFVLLTVATILMVLSLSAANSVPTSGEYFDWIVYTEGKEVWSVSYDILKTSTFLHSEGEAYSSQFKPDISGAFWFELSVYSYSTDAYAYLEYYNNGWRTYITLSAYTDDEGEPQPSVAPRVLGFRSKTLKC